jgi:RNA polymerase sigma-70 factor (ECF subfamily)
MTDEELFHRARDGDEAAFRSLYEKYRDPLFRFAYRLTGAPDAAEDTVHDCFAALFHARFEGSRGSLRTYVYGAVRNLARKRHRDAGREDQADEFDERPASAADPLSALVSRETSEGVRLAVEALPLLQREVLVLFEYEELSLEEIAAIVEADVGAVKSRLHRARERLRRSLVPATRGTGK